MHPDPVTNGSFAAALFNPDLPPPSGLGTDLASPVTRRFGVYRNNVSVSLVDALASIFPTLQNLVGEEFFRAMAHVHVRVEPPRSPLIFTYGAGFADFIATFPPAADLPFLADVARVERAWLDAFHAADAAPLSPDQLAGLSPDVLPQARFIPHPATRLLATVHAAGSIVARDRVGLPLDGLNPHLAETVLITRPAYDVSITVLPAGGGAFFAALIAGEPLATACENAERERADADISALITLALSTGAFSGLAASGERI